MNFKKFQSKRWIFTIVLILVFVSVTIGFVNKKKTNFISQVDPKFSGYNENGHLNYNEDDLEHSIQEYLLIESGLSKDQAKGLISENEVTIDYIKSNPNEYEKAYQAYQAFESIEYGFDKTSELTNGDTVKFTITSTSSDFPLPDQEKEYKVTGLKKGENIDIKSIVDKEPIVFSGFDGAGKAIYDDFVYEELAGNGNYSNGDSVNIKVSDSYINELEDEGKFLKGDNIVELNISNLDDFSDISNISDILSLIDDLSKKEFEGYDYGFTSTTYTSTNKGNYYCSEKGLLSDKETFRVLSIYEVREIDRDSDGEETENKVFYKALGYSSIPYQNGKLDISDNGYEDYYGSEDTLELLLANLRTDYKGIKEIKNQ